MVFLQNLATWPTCFWLLGHVDTSKGTTKSADDAALVPRWFWVGLLVWVVGLVDWNAYIYIILYYIILYYIILYKEIPIYIYTLYIIYVYRLVQFSWSFLSNFRTTKTWEKYGNLYFWNRRFLENKLLLISISFTPKASHSCLKNDTLCFPGWYSCSQRFIADFGLSFTHFGQSDKMSE